MNIDNYLAEIVEPTFVDFERNPSSPRHAYLACLTMTHVVDHAALSVYQHSPSLEEVKKLREEWRGLSKPFLIVDEVAQYFKHGTRIWVEKAERNNPGKLRITHAIGLENGGLAVNDLHNLYFQVRDALDFVRKQLNCST